MSINSVAPISGMLRREHLPEQKSDTQRQQIFPPRSVSSLLEGSAVTPPSLRDGEDDAVVGMGGKLRSTRRNEKQDGAQGWRKRALLLGRSLLEAGDSRALALLAEEESYSQTSDILAALRAEGRDIGEMIALLSSLAAGGSSPSLRKRFLDALERLLAETDEAEWAVGLYSWLEFGYSSANRRMLRKLYQHAREDSEASESMREWLARLGPTEDRKRRLLVLIRALGEDLSWQSAPHDSARVDNVVQDLKRLLLILGAEFQCQDIAQAVNDHSVTGELVLQDVVEILDAIWVSIDNVRSTVTNRASSPTTTATYCRRLGRLISYLPDLCYRDDDHRNDLKVVFLTLNDEFADF